MYKKSSDGKCFAVINYNVPASALDSGHPSIKELQRCPDSCSPGMAFQSTSVLTKVTADISDPEVFVDLTNKFSVVNNMQISGGFISIWNSQTDIREPIS